MKATELRIGNWVNYENEIFFIQDISMFQGIYCSNLFKSVFDSFPTYSNKRIAFFNPIPLTEELLVKFGFKNHHNNWYEINVFNTDAYFNHINISIDINRVTISDGDNEIVINDELKHVHQLQNLYWCLTQKELHYEI